MESDIITSKKVRWAISFLKPYKIAGLNSRNASTIALYSDRSIGTHLQKLPVDDIHSVKMEEGKSDLHLPKAGKSSHNQPIDYRPIRLPSFLLSVLKRLSSISKGLPVTRLLNR